MKPDIKEIVFPQDHIDFIKILIDPNSRTDAYEIKTSIVITSAQIEELLAESLRKRFLHSNSNIGNDDLFKGSALSSYNRIELAYRTGVISSGMREALQALRELRNKAAHVKDDINEKLFIENSLIIKRFVEKLSFLKILKSREKNNQFFQNSTKTFKLHLAILVIQLWREKTLIKPLIEGNWLNAKFFN